MQADPTFQGRQAQYRELAYQQEAARQAERDRLRLERQGPVQAVADLFRERFQDDLPEIYEVLSKPQGVAKLLPILKTMAAEDVKARRDAAEAARVEAERARMEADAERRVAAIAADRTKRKVREAARAEAETTPAKIEEEAA